MVRGAATSRLCLPLLCLVAGGGGGGGGGRVRFRGGFIPGVSAQRWAGEDVQGSREERGGGRRGLHQMPVTNEGGATEKSDKNHAGRRLHDSSGTATVRPDWGEGISRPEMGVDRIGGPKHGLQRWSRGNSHEGGHRWSRNGGVAFVGDMADGGSSGSASVLLRGSNRDVSGGRTLTGVVVYGGDGQSQGESKRWQGERCWFDQTGRQRCQANVFFFGVSKCGTTSLATWMSYHPALRWVSNPALMENEATEAHILDELGSVSFQAMLRQGKKGKYGRMAPVAGEADKVIDYTPHYSIKAEVPYRILDIYGEAARDGSNKYIVQLRDPVTRAISSWRRKFDLNMLQDSLDGKGAKAEHLFLAEAIRQGQDGVLALLDCQEKEREKYDPSAWTPELQREMDLERCRLKDILGDLHGLYNAHVAKGMYAMQLQRWFDLVGRENVKVTFLEETTIEPVEALEDIFDFIGLDLLDEEGKEGLPSREDWEYVVEIIHNETEDERKRLLNRQVTRELLQSMRNFYAPFNAELQELLGRPLPDNWSLPDSSL